LAVLSIDDLYLTHDGLVELAAQNLNNKLWTGRGQPGTHDVGLGADVLRRLRDINASPQSEVILPVFDKSKFNGEGDRLPGGVPVSGPVDVVIFEGWCVGFYPLTDEELGAKWEGVRRETEARPEGIVARAMAPVRKEDILVVNEALREYVMAWYDFFDVFVQVSEYNILIFHAIVLKQC